MDDGQLKNYRLAVLTETAIGSRLGVVWPKGLLVKAEKCPALGRNKYTIERMKNKKPFLPLREQLCDVPGRKLEFQ